MPGCPPSCPLPACPAASSRAPLPTFLSARPRAPLPLPYSFARPRAHLPHPHACSSAGGSVFSEASLELRRASGDEAPPEASSDSVTNCGAQSVRTLQEKEVLTPGTRRILFAFHVGHCTHTRDNVSKSFQLNLHPRSFEKAGHQSSCVTGHTQSIVENREPIGGTSFRRLCFQRKEG